MKLLILLLLPLSLFSQRVQERQLPQADGKWVVRDTLAVGTYSPAQRVHIVGNVRFSGALMPAGVAGSIGQVLTSAGAGTAPTWEPAVAVNGITVTPTGTIISNVDAVTPFALHYTRVGSTVTFSGTVDIDITLAVGSAVVELSLPIASNFSATTDAAGVIVPTNVAVFGGYITGSVANDRLVLTVSAVGTGTVTYPFTGSYIIK